MATVATNTPALSSTRSGLLARLSLRLAQHRAYRETYKGLSRLSDRELADVGLTRGLIDEVSRSVSASV